MIIYEVNLVVSAEIIDEYRTWLKDHIEHMLTIDGFHKAAVFDELTNASQKEHHMTVHYELKSEEALNNYFKHHAARLRAESLRTFQEKVSASRRVLHPFFAAKK